MKKWGISSEKMGDECDLSRGKTGTSPISRLGVHWIFTFNTAIFQHQTWGVSETPTSSQPTICAIPFGYPRVILTRLKYIDIDSQTAGPAEYCLPLTILVALSPCKTFIYIYTCITCSTWHGGLSCKPVLGLLWMLIHQKLGYAAQITWVFFTGKVGT